MNSSLNKPAKPVIHHNGKKTPTLLYMSDLEDLFRFSLARVHFRSAVAHNSAMKDTDQDRVQAERSKAQI
jgi:hypothetical protein